MWKRPSSNAEAGLTLLELLVALAMSALVGVAVFTMQNSVLGAFDQARQVRREMFGLQVATETLNDDFRSAYTCRCDDEDHFFIGSSADRTEDPFLEFTTTASLDMEADPAGLDLRRVRYVLVSGRTKGLNDLVRQERAYAGIDGEFPWSGVVLVRDVRELDIEYLDGSMDTYVSSFTSDPTSRNRPMLPRALRLRILCGKEDSDRGTDIVVERPVWAYTLVRP